MIQPQFERLAAAGIDLVLVDGMARHFVFARDGFVSLVERRDEGFGSIGAAGLATESGFAALCWKSGRPFFVARGFEKAATDVEVQRLRAFERDLRQALA